MKLLQNILAAVDLKESTQGVIETSAYLAKQFNSHVSLIHVIDEDPVSIDLRNILKESIESKLLTYVNTIKSNGVTVDEVIVEYGIPFEKIIQQGQKKNYNVIVAGSGNKTEEDSFQLGTTVEKLMRKNQVPLWVVKSKNFTEPKNLLCPVDFSEASKRALNNAITLASKFKAKLTVLNVFSPVNIFSPRFEVDNEKENASRKLNQEKELYRFLKQFNLVSLKHDVQIAVGEPHQGILNYIRANSVDLLLMGTTGKTILSRLLMGSVTEKVTREMPCSFITTKALDITDAYFESNLKSIEYLLNLAKTYYNDKNYEKALEKYTMAHKQYPDNIPLIMGLINTHKALGNNSSVSHFKEYAREIIRRTWGEDFIDKILPK